MGVDQGPVRRRQNRDSLTAAANYAPTIVQPKVSAATHPVRQRHRSTAICRAIATMAFFFAPFVAFGLPNTCHHFFTSTQLRCYTTSRQASSTNAMRKPTLPCLVIGSI